MSGSSKTNRAQRRAAAHAEKSPVVALSAIDPAPPRTVIGRQSPIATIQRWRGENWADLFWGDVVSLMRGCELTGATEEWARFTRRMFTDGHLIGLRGTRIDPIAAARYDVDAGGPEEIDKLAALDVALMLKSIPNFETVIDHGLDAIFVGWSVSEIIWEPRGQWMWPAQIDLLEPHRFRFDQTFNPYIWDDGRLGNDPGANSAIQLLGMPLRANKYLVHMPRALPDYPVASGLLRACARYWWAKWWGVRYWLAGAEIAGNPRLVGKYAKGADESVRDAMYSMMSNIQADGIALISDDSDLDLLNGAAEGAGGIFDGITRWADSGMSKTILGSGLNTEVDEGGGNRALGESQGERTMDPRKVLDAAKWWATVQRCLVKPFLEMNPWRYGGRMPAVPVIRSVFSESPTPTIDDVLIDTGNATNDEVRQAKGLPERTDGMGNAFARRASDPLPVVAPVGGAAAPQESVADTALNGAQVTSLQGMLAAITAGQLAPAAAVIAITKAFPAFTAAEVQAMANAQAGLPPPVTGPAPTIQSPPVEAAAAVPFRANRESPWDTAMRIALTSTAATPTRSP